MTNLHCPACHAPRHAGHYLCRSCWNQLPAPARRALTRRDRFALARLRELHQQLADGSALDRITVTP